MSDYEQLSLSDKAEVQRLEDIKVFEMADMMASCPDGCLLVWDDEYL